MKYDYDLSPLEERLGIEFKNKELLLQAVVHRSFLNENRDFELGHNERLEFLGDAVLELVVTEHLFNNYDNPEGELTNWRAALVNAKTLADVSAELGVSDFLLLSKGEKKDKGKARAYILANATEALIGAMYLDQGWDAAKQFIDGHILSRLEHILEHKLYLDPKSRFQEAAQEKVGVTPTYSVLKEDGPDHAKVFTVGVYVDDDLVAQGDGTSKQEAQTEAAQKALDLKGWA